MGQQRWRLDLAYDGSHFRGFAVQQGQRTVAGELASALSKTCRLSEPPVLVCAGRTDAGVHADAQVVHVDLPDPLPPGRDGLEMDTTTVLRSVNAQLHSTVVVYAMTRVDEGFDARHSATERRYRYLIWNGSHTEPLMDHVSWHVGAPLDVRAMNQAALCLIGEHDFRAFCRKVKGTSNDTPIPRRVHDVSVGIMEVGDLFPRQRGQLIRVDISANAFCHQMVRSIVGQLVSIGLSHTHGADLVALLTSGARQGAAQPAPPRGLCLVGVSYDTSSP